MYIYALREEISTQIPNSIDKKWSVVPFSRNVVCTSLLIKPDYWMIYVGKQKTRSKHVYCIQFLIQ